METDWSKEAPEISIIPGTGRGGTMSPDVCISQRRLPGPRGNILGSKRFISQKSREKMYSSMFPKVIVKEKVERGSVVRLEQEILWGAGAPSGRHFKWAEVILGMEATLEFCQVP